MVGVYTVNLDVSDFLGFGTPDTVLITATTLQGFVEDRNMCTDDIVKDLGRDQFTNRGNKKKLLKLLSKTVSQKHGHHKHHKDDDDDRHDVRRNDESEEHFNVRKALKTLNKAISRTDGCATNGSPDSRGHGRDWITTYTDQ